MRCFQPFDDPSADNGRSPAATTREAAFAIRFPFGDVPIDGSLRVGREPTFSPIAQKLEGYGTVGRRHAELSVRGDELLITDLLSTNHVFVNDRQIPPNEPTPLKPGDEVLFSRQLRSAIISGRR